MLNMAAKLSNYGQYKGYNGRKFNSLSYVIPRAPVSKSEGDLKSKRGKGSIPEWQTRPWSVTSQQNVLDFLSISAAENRDLETRMHRHYPRTNTPLDFYSVYDISDEVTRVRRLSSGNSRSVTPSRGRQSVYSRGSVDFSVGGRQEAYYNETLKTYDVTRGQEKRQSEFVHKYVTYRSRLTREKLKEQRDAERRRIEKENQILKELKKKRTEFQREKDWRVRTQYVTSKILEHERIDRESYGLPLYVQADFYLKKRRPKKLAPIKQILNNETSRYQNISEKLVKNMYGKSYPTIEPGIKPPAFGWKNKRKNETYSKDHVNGKDFDSATLDMHNKLDKTRSQGQSQGKSKPKSRDRNQGNYKDGGQIARGRICPTTSWNNPKTGNPPVWSTVRHKSKMTYSFQQFGGPFRQKSTQVH